jgi:tRNA-(ms[2]io[6]A)-hydroxylase
VGSRWARRPSIPTPPSCGGSPPRTASVVPSPIRVVAWSIRSLVDRLLVAAIIEARSCERFRLLADALAGRGSASVAAGGDTELAAFYEELFASEARHFATLVELAIEAAGGAERTVRDRLAALAQAEGGLIERLRAEPSVHG